MTPRQLQTLILSGPKAAECAPHVHTNDMPKISASEALAKDGAIATILNAAGAGASSKPIEAWKAKKLLIKTGRWRMIVEASNNPEHPGRDVAYAAVALAEDARMDADFLDAGAAPMLASMVSTGLITEEISAALKALCYVKSAITAAEVSNAVRGPWGDE